VERGGEVARRQRLAALRRVDDRRVEDDVVGEQRIETRGVARADEAMPGVEGGVRDGELLSRA
jgi:hypothetical protein